MEKVLLRRQLVIENDIYIPKWYCTKRMVNHKENKGRGLIAGWNIEKEGVDCNPKCRGAITGGVEICISGECVFIPNPE